MGKSKEIILSKNKLLIMGASLAALAIILILGYLWHSQASSLKAQQEQQEQEIQDLEDKIKVSKENTKKEDQSLNSINSLDTLKIQEWGINLEFDKAYQVTYTLSKDGAAQTVSFTIKDNSVNTSSCVNQSKDLDINLTRTDIKTDGTHGTPVKIGSYYYYTSGSPYVCSADVDKDDAPRNIIISQLNKALTNFLKK